MIARAAVLAGVRSLTGRRVLVASDSPDIAALVADTFASVGARPIQANSPTQAKLCLLAGGFDIMVLDLGAPRPGGWNALQLMGRHLALRGRTIILTANRYDPLVAQAIQAHAVARLFKPFLLSDLIALAGDLLANYEHTWAA
jgi:DNA-binding response OmpR family regulator